jgi:hypothetical protein
MAPPPPVAAWRLRRPLPSPHRATFATDEYLWGSALSRRLCANAYYLTIRRSLHHRAEFSARMLCNLYNGNFYSNFCPAVGRPQSLHTLTDVGNLLARSSQPVRRLDLAQAISQCAGLRIIAGRARGRGRAALAIGRAHARYTNDVRRCTDPAGAVRWKGAGSLQRRTFRGQRLGYGAGWP